VSKSNEIGYDLLKLADVLNKYGFCNDTSPLQNAGRSCIGTGKTGIWRYNLDKIAFDVDEPSGRIPLTCSDIKVSLSISISGKESDSGDIDNPLETLLFNLEVDGRERDEAAENDEPVQLYSSWHLDRHDLTQAGSGTPKYSHPLYHFAYGGYKMEAMHKEIGRCIILPAPRIIYPPMDGALGIDFVLQNYVSERSLRPMIENSDYRRIMKNSQERLWKPFFKSMYSFWEPTGLTVKQHFTPVELMPLYVK
jgi:hypothetical protein